MSDWLPGAVKGHMTEWRSNFRTYTAQEGRRRVSIPIIVRLIYVSLLKKHFFWAELIGIMSPFYIVAPKHAGMHHCVRLPKKGSQKKQHYSGSLRDIFTRPHEKSSRVEGFLEVRGQRLSLSFLACSAGPVQEVSARALSPRLKAVAASCPDKNHRRRPRKDGWSREFVIQRGEVSSPAAGLEK